MTTLYGDIEPYAAGHLNVGDGHSIYWETCGNPIGKAAVVLHGGPGSGCTPWHRSLFDPKKYCIVLFDQRSCGRSTPHARQRKVDLSANTTPHLVEDIEHLREHLAIERWLLLGGSWGSTLALAYAEKYPARVTELVLFGVTTGRHSEVDWLFRGGLARLFPAEWQRLQEAIPYDLKELDIPEAYHRLLCDTDVAVQHRAAESWCLWESATPEWPPSTVMAERFRDSEFALAFSRLVTHYMRHNLFLEDKILLQNAEALADTPGVLINGRFDFQAPLENAWELKRVWPRAELIVVDDAGHNVRNPGLADELVRVIDRFALN